MYYMIRPGQSLGNFTEQIPRAFSKPVDWKTIQAFTQKSDEPVHDYYNQFQIVFKENSGLRMWFPS